MPAPIGMQISLGRHSGSRDISCSGCSPVAKSLARGDVEQRLRAAAAQGQQLAEAAQEAGHNAVRQGGAPDAVRAAQSAAESAAEALQQIAQQTQQSVAPQLRAAVGHVSAQGATLKVSKRLTMQIVFDCGQHCEPCPYRGIEEVHLEDGRCIIPHSIVVNDGLPGKLMPLVIDATGHS